MWICLKASIQMHLINMNLNKESDIYLAFAKKIAFQAGAILEQHRHSFVIQKTKDELHLDIATSADYAAEKAYIEAIHLAFPTHGILAEESGVSLPGSDFVWIIDPLDGTKEYTKNTPYYYTLLSLEYKGQPVCAVGYQPAINRIFFGSIKSAAYVDGDKMSVSKESYLNKSFINISIPNGKMPKDESSTYFQTIQDLLYLTYRLRNTMWDVEALFNVATGMSDAYILPSSKTIGGPKWWDISPGLQLVEMAGGTITDFAGNPLRSRDSSNGILASNGLIHEQLLEIIHKYYPKT